MLDLVPDYQRCGAQGDPNATIDVRHASMLRYASLLPVSEAALLRSRLDVGWTPLIETQALAHRFGLRRLSIKDEGRNPTGSLKDRASNLVVASAVEARQSVICTASSGNAAIALAGCAVAARIPVVVFVPDGVPPAKLTQLSIYGATVVVMRAGYEAAVRASYWACEEFGWYCRSTAYNPFTAEGKKTVALEILEQRNWCVPDAVIVPTGDGNIVAGVHRGFVDACEMGWTSSVPRIIAVQSAAAPALYNAFKNGSLDAEPCAAASRAESISVAVPQDGFRALRAVRATEGVVATVEDDMLAGATALLAQTVGVFGEPAAVVGIAALSDLVDGGVLTRDDDVVVLCTGSGLKDPGLASQVSRHAVRVEAHGTLETLRSVCSSLPGTRVLQGVT